MAAETEKLDAVGRLWDAHLRADFPPYLRGAELLGIDMVLLDAEVAGCVSSWLHGRGHLDEERRRILACSVADLNNVLPILADHQVGAYAYYGRLRAMAVATLGAA